MRGLMKVKLDYLGGKEIDSDELTREIVDTHFDPEWGTPYWLGKEKELGIDARTDIRGFDDLQILGPMDEDALRTRRAEDLMPRRYMDRKNTVNLYTTGGTTGLPKLSLVSDETIRKTFDYFNHSAKEAGIPYGGNILYIGPTGPTFIGDASGMIADEMGSWVYKIHLDTLWIKKVQERAMKGDKEAGRELGEYMKHMFDQSMPILRTQNIGILFTTAKILEGMAEKLPGPAIKSLGLKGIVHGGMPITPETYKMLREEIFEGVPILGVYGNSLWGAACQVSPVVENNSDYAPLFPYITFDIVDPYSRQPVKEGERGQVVFSRLSPEFLIANMYERDEATRLNSAGRYNWVCARNPDMPRALKDKVASGVY